MILRIFLYAKIFILSKVLTECDEVYIINFVVSQEAIETEKRICGCAGIGRQARLRGVCSQDVWVQVPSTAPF